MADLPSRSEGFLRHERVHAIGRYDGDWPEDVRDQSAPGAKFDGKIRSIVFSRLAPPADAPPGVEFISEAVGPFMDRLRAQPGKDIWLMGGGEIIASFLDAHAIDEFVVSVVPVFIGEGIPLIARRPRHVPLELLSSERFEDGLVQNRYRVQGRD